eukprot:TRINITY_DN8228_c1_g1_i1.p1 TRINITY_DN8228_c1_g1~~TRINITY_DN8228_c1_g1_i1.p1  ORF type:complete len:631 (+),score=66.96 TRINITY_DN8228_c1_g1_i1:58-1950(+)
MIPHMLHSYVLAGGGALLALHVMLHLKSTAAAIGIPRGRWWAATTPMASGFQASLKVAMAFLDGYVADERELAREMVVKRIDIRRKQLLCWLLPRLTGVGMVIVGYFACNTFRGADRWYTPEQDLIAVIICLVCVIWQRYPRILDARGNLFFSFVVMLLFVAWHGIASPTLPEAFALNSAATFGARFLFCVASMRRCLTISWSVLSFAVTTFSVWSFSEDDRWGCVITNLGDSLLYELVFSFFLIFCSEAVRGWVVCHICDELEKEETKSGSNAAVALLNTVCDASAQLDDDLVISEDASRLGAMLLHSSNRSLKGVPFSKLLSSDIDRERFASRARARANVQQQENALADLFHVHVRDNTNNDVEVEVYLVSFTSYCDRTKFLVGIREQAVDVVAPVADVPAQVSFDASTLEMVRRSSSFDLRGPNGSCEAGDCLREWFVTDAVTDEFFYDLQMAVGAVACSGEPFTFTSSVVLQDLVKPGTQYVSGHRFLATCCVRVSLENVKLEHMRGRVRSDLAADIGSEGARSSCDATTHVSDRGSGLFAEVFRRSDGGADEANDDVAASDDLSTGKASTLPRIIANMELDTISRKRTCRSKIMSKSSKRMNPTSDLSNQARSNSTINDLPQIRL